MMTISVQRSLKEGTYGVTLIDWKWVSSKTGLDGLQMDLKVQDSANNGSVRTESAFFFGYKAKEAVEALCDNYDSDFGGSLDELMKHFTENSVVATYEKEDGFARWSF